MADSNEIILTKSKLDAMERPMILDLNNLSGTYWYDQLAKQASETVDF
jgi:hypothetical protein